MKRARHRPEQIIAGLGEADALLATAPERTYGKTDGELTILAMGTRYKSPHKGIGPCAAM